MRPALAALAVLVAMLVSAAPASAVIPSVFGGAAPCGPSAVAGAQPGTRDCSGKVNAFDGVPIDVNVSFPPASGADNNYPLVMVFHGYGGSKLGFDSLHHWTSQGYAAFSMSDRGFGESCGSLASRAANPAGCAQGWVKLLDTRFEVRDAQEFAGTLADQGVVNPQLIAATGGSYGGGMSMALAALKDRKMLPDGSLVAWTSPTSHLPMRIAAAAPEIPWTDLAYSLAPNGRTLDYVADAPYRGPNGDAPLGIEKQSFVAGLFASGQASGYYAPPGVDSGADLTNWYAQINAGEPYGPTVGAILDELTAHHSSYYIDHSQPPAPLLISNGTTDDLFPPDEDVRFYNRTRTQYPNDPISLYWLDYGHQRGQNKAADKALLLARQDAWFAHFLKGSGSAPTGFDVLTKTCPASAASDGPFHSDNVRNGQPGEIRLDSAASQTIAPAVPSDANVAHNFDPIAGGGACATASGSDQTGAATYRLPEAPTGGFTLLGGATIIAKIAAPAAANSQIAARLEDVAPDGNETLVARGLYRPDASGPQIFQLHPDAWNFAKGHIAKLELLPSDVPYARASNAQAPITVSDLELRLPVREAPGSLGGLVQSPSPKVLPPGYALAIDYKVDGSVALADFFKGKGRARLAKGPLRLGSGKLFARLVCSGKQACSGTLMAQRLIGRKGKGKRHARRHGGGPTIGKGSFALSAGATNLVAFPLSKAGKHMLKRSIRGKARVRLRSGGRTSKAVRRVRPAAKKRHG